MSDQAADPDIYASFVKGFRVKAAEAGDRAEYYHAALRFWRGAPRSSCDTIAVTAIREAAALDGVQLEEEP